MALWKGWSWLSPARVCANGFAEGVIPLPALFIEEGIFPMERQRSREFPGSPWQWSGLGAFTARTLSSHSASHTSHQKKRRERQMSRGDLVNHEV